MSKNTGGPAFPVDTSVNELGEATIHQTGNWTGQFPGMTLRDYFAAKAMTAYISNPDMIHKLCGTGSVSISELSYIQADAMLKERAK